MSGPNTGGWVSMPGGYDAARAQAGQAPVAPQNGQQAQTQLGQPTQQGFAPAPVIQEGQSPIQNVRTPLPWERTQQVQPQPGQQPAPQLTQQQQQQVQQGQAPTGVDLNQRVYGQNIPQELQGRTVGEVINMINGLRQIHLQSLQQSGQPVPTNQVQQAPAPRPNDPPAGTPPAFDWRNPDASIGRVVEDRVGKIIDQKLMPALAPTMVQAQTTAVVGARNQVAAEIPNFAQIEPLIYQRLAGIPPEALANPESWRIAARVVLGDLAIQSFQQGQGQGQQGLQPQQNGISQQVQTGWPPQTVQPGQNPLPNLNSFFSEQSMQGGPNGTGGVKLTQEQMRAADAMNISHADYAAWAVGVRTDGGRR